MNNNSSKNGKKKSKEKIIVTLIVILLFALLIFKMLAANFGFGEFTLEQLLSKENLLKTVKVACLVLPLVALILVLKLYAFKRIKKK